MKFELKGNYFDNQFTLPPVSGILATEKSIDKFSPANLNQKLWSCPIDGRHVAPVVESAVKGHKKWRTLSFDERANYLKRYQEIVLTKKDQFAEAIALETGKPLWESTTEAQALSAKVDVTLNESLKRIHQKSYPEIAPATQGELFYRPIGPCLIIGPFNFPCHLANGQILSALLAGNSIVFKPSERTCYSGQLLIECFDQAGFPEGVINMIQGDGDISSRLVKHKSFKGIFFTGSAEVGKKILSSTSTDLSKLVALELGGKNTSIIHKDAQLNHTMEELVKAAFWTTGQRCTSTALVPIHRSLHQEFIEIFHKIAKRIIVDHPIEFDERPFMGPLIDQKSLDSYLLFMGMAKREGIEEIMRGKQLEKKFPGHYVGPSIHFSEKWDDKSHFLSSEIFGPNCTFIPYDEIEEAIEMANSTQYGLAASVFTQESKVFDQCVRDIDSGLLNLNRSTVGASAKLPFGGVKNSGNYRPAAVATIDSCVYQMASLKLSVEQDKDAPILDGLMPN